MWNSRAQKIMQSFNKGTDTLFSLRCQIHEYTVKDQFRLNVTMLWAESYLWIALRKCMVHLSTGYSVSLVTVVFVSLFSY